MKVVRLINNKGRLVKIVGQPYISCLIGQPSGACQALNMDIFGDASHPICDMSINL